MEQSMDEHEKVEGLEEERKVEYTDFIGHFQNWFKPQHIQNFLDYYEFCESVGAVGTRQQSGDGNRIMKADTATCYNHTQLSENNEIMGNDKFHDFLKYINGDILEYYNTQYPGFGRPVAIDCKIQKTQPSEGYHIWHCEKAATNSTRVLAWMLYLNDVEEGGETEFLHQKLRYPPKKGDFLVWPASFTHMHRGNPPLSNTKYIVTGWYEWIGINDEFTHILP
tara:strand:- start:515 stop:1183 length:669 start_codon:yes stop_codon:yes gene_type:complete